MSIINQYKADSAVQLHMEKGWQKSNHALLYIDIIQFTESKHTLEFYFTIDWWDVKNKTENISRIDQFLWTSYSPPWSKKVFLTVGLTCQ